MILFEVDFTTLINENSILSDKEFLKRQFLRDLLKKIESRLEATLFRISPGTRPLVYGENVYDVNISKALKDLAKSMVVREALDNHSFDFDESRRRYMEDIPSQLLLQIFEYGVEDFPKVAVLKDIIDHFRRNLQHYWLVFQQTYRMEGINEPSNV